MVIGGHFSSNVLPGPDNKHSLIYTHRAGECCYASQCFSFTAQDVPLLYTPPKNTGFTGGGHFVLLLLFCSFLYFEDMLKGSLAMLKLLSLWTQYTALQMSPQLARKVTRNFRTLSTSLQWTGCKLERRRSLSELIKSAAGHLEPFWNSSLQDGDGHDAHIKLSLVETILRLSLQRMTSRQQPNTPVICLSVY